MKHCTSWTYTGKFLHPLQQLVQSFASTVAEDIWRPSIDQTMIYLWSTSMDFMLGSKHFIAFLGGDQQNSSFENELGCNQSSLAQWIGSGANVNRKPLETIIFFMSFSVFPMKYGAFRGKCSVQPIQSFRITNNTVLIRTFNAKHGETWGH